MSSSRYIEVFKSDQSEAMRAKDRSINQGGFGARGRGFGGGFGGGPMRGGGGGFGGRGRPSPYDRSGGFGGDMGGFGNGGGGPMRNPFGAGIIYYFKLI